MKRLLVAMIVASIQPSLGYADENSIVDTFTNSSIDGAEGFGDLKRFKIVSKNDGGVAGHDPMIIFQLEGSASTGCDKLGGEKNIGLQYETIESKDAKKHYVIRPMTYSKRANGLEFRENLFCVKMDFDNYFITKLKLVIAKNSDGPKDGNYIYEFPMRNLYSIYLKVKFSKTSGWSWEIDDSGYYKSIGIEKEEYVKLTGKSEADIWN